MKCITVKMMTATCVVNVVLKEAQFKGENVACGMQYLVAACLCRWPA